MNQFLAFPLEYIPYVAITLIIAFTLHEFAHAFVAYKFGDETAKKQGRLTLSPLSHLDPLGTILLLVVGFGWAKPVPVNRFFFKNPRLAGVLVSIAGPLSNLFLAFLGVLGWFLILQFAGYIDPLYKFFNMFITINIVLFLFNLLPFPPLDGYRIVEDLVPNTVRAKMTQYESWGILLFLVLIITPLDRYIIAPIYDIGIPFFVELFQQLLGPLLT
ncbi:site-2 protease family protein [Priestia flexa]|uniref:Site-2 protease family protein n=1 Tax=Priestia flexa TaxID=86664 RepID=A0A1N6PBI6_9BACI|nr:MULTISPECIES: site-2 protease family protein [Bacillaceae]AQX53140.1 zinc metalloprotease [Priestia flexa]KZB92399.1 zinc metalloprotease [Bacillus sp. VT 712]MBN8253387.1 site-2 protease family protein [Priestia flexa]MBN8433535.1 site-2 protease family protein [Priestia flexa]MBY6086764.1 site-2 protease family protein [Priestia flexa]